MPKEAQKTFEQNMEAMSKMSPAEVQAKIKELDKICICIKCPVQKSMALRWDRYCLKGSGKEQSGMK